MDMDGYLAWHNGRRALPFRHGPTTTGRDAIREALDQYLGNDCRLRHEFVQVWDTETRPSSKHTVYTRQDGSEVGIRSQRSCADRGDLVADIRIFIDLGRRSSPGGTRKLNRSRERGRAVVGLPSAHDLGCAQAICLGSGNSPMHRATRQCARLCVGRQRWPQALQLHGQGHLHSRRQRVGQPQVGDLRVRKASSDE